MKTEFLALDGVSDLTEALRPAADIIKQGGLVVFPTETVYGLGADATSSEAAAKIYAAKGRPSDNPLIIHISEPEWAEKYAFTNEAYYKLAKSFMPGPLTVVLRARDSIPTQTRGGLPTVAVRCPSNLAARTLIALSGVPIAAPSANISGSPSPTRADHVRDDMEGRVDMIIDGGECDFGLESTIVSVNDDNSVTMLRPGKITISDIEAMGLRCFVADAVTSKLSEGQRPLSPGMKYRHYAPKSPVVLIDGEFPQIIDYIKAENKNNIAIIAFTEYCQLAGNVFPLADIYDFSMQEDKVGQAHKLFSILRDADKKNYEVIYAPLPSTDGIGLALYNRMIRAAAYRIIKL